MGRFLSPDWSANQDPVPYASLDNPQSLNLYSYVRNNPLIRGDLDGHHAASDPCKGNNDTCVSVTVKQSIWNRIGNWFRSGGDAISDSAIGISFARFGRLGGPAHRAAVGRISNLLQKDGYSVTPEKYFRTPNGSKSGRFVDVYGQKTTKDGVQEKIFQVGRTNADGTPVSREVQAMDDIQAVPANTGGLRPEFVDYNSPLATGDFAPVSPMSDMPMSVPKDIPIDPIP